MPVGSDSAYSNARVVRRLLAMVWRYRWGCIRTLALQVALLTLGLMGLGLTGIGVDYLRQVLEERAGAAVMVVPRWPLGWVPPADWAPFTVIALVAGAILAFAAVRALLSITYTISMNNLLQGRIVVDWRARVYEKMQQLSFTFFDANASGTIINRVTTDVQGVRSFVDGVVLQTVILLLSLAVYLVYMLNIHVGLTLACLSTTPILWVVTARFARRVRAAYIESRKLFDDLILAVSENVQGVHVVKGFVRGEEQSRAFEAAVERVRSQKRWIFRQIAIFQPVMGFLTQVNLVVLLAYGGLLVIRREAGEGLAGVSIGDLIVFAGLLQQFSGQVSGISTIADCMQQSLTSAQRVFEILDAPVAVASRPGAVVLSRARGSITFERASLGYTPDAPVLQDVSFTAAAGSRVAILGATGAGKTTLLSLLPRFYDVTGGAVKIDGRDVRDYTLDSLRRNIGIVFQDSFLFSNTVRANIAFGHPEATGEQIERAARLAAADGFIRALPRGYDTLLNEAGANLSGGQRQRLAIARALLLDPPILLLDDPTAAVDPGTETEIMDAIEQATAGRTVLIVAHRLSTLRRADTVIVLDHGRIAQQGVHASLLRDDGIYAQVAATQSHNGEASA